MVQDLSKASTAEASVGMNKNPGGLERPARVQGGGLPFQAGAPLPISLWLLFCVYCNCSGWLLSLAGHLNAAGYAVAFAPGLLILFWWLAKRPTPQIRRSWPQTMRRRFRRPFAMGFLFLAVMAFSGGVLYAPTNYDALAYRVPRILNWLAEGQWHWISTEFNRLNTRAFGFEWLATPVIALTRTDRFLFLINIVSLLLMPGLVFSLFTRLGVSPRASWHWMWLVPTGYCFLLQAGSIGNDLFGAVFALAAIDFSLRARASQNPRDVWFSVLAVALLTGSKASNLPLLLPWAVAILPSLRLAARKPALAFAVGLVALVASLAPLIGINLRHSGDWTGIRAENVYALEHSSALNLANNTVLLGIQNLVPPVFPIAGKWNSAVERTMPASWRAKLEKAFEPGGAHWALGELQVEEGAGLGFGVSALLLAAVAATYSLSRGGRALLRAPGWQRTASPASPPAPPTRSSGLHTKAVLTAAFVALGAFMVKSGLTTAARLITPYYGLLIPALLLSPKQALVIRKRWWQLAAFGVFALGGLLLILSPSRPLWPANFILSRFDSHGRLVERARAVYQVYSQRADGFAPARNLLPPGERVVGLIATDDPETSLWRPFGSRRIVHVTRSDTTAELRARNIRYVLVNSRKLEMAFRKSFEEWLRDMNGQIESSITLALRVTDGPSHWSLVKLP
jgi:hypothetical protein